MANNNTKVSKESSKKEKDKDEVKVIKTPVDLQRLKLEKLMSNPTKEVVIPEKSKEKALRAPLEFIRNIWGSSAGAGSGDFHVYRGVRRREYARQKFIKEMADKEEADLAYKKSLEQHKLEAEQRTSKKRAKRLKKKEKLKAKKMKKKTGSDSKTKSESDNDSDASESGGDSEADQSVSEDNSNHATALSNHATSNPDDDAQSNQDDERTHNETQSSPKGESNRDYTHQNSPQCNVESEDNATT
ncbi:PRKR-interacting protein 1 [Biomphalaria glabrata]|nr:putative PRKR-interacting protein 1 [Biomphalaria glabrata]